MNSLIKDSENVVIEAEQVQQFLDRVSEIESGYQLAIKSLVVEHQAATEPSAAKSLLSTFLLPVVLARAETHGRLSVELGAVASEMTGPVAALAESTAAARTRINVARADLNDVDGRLQRAQDAATQAAQEVEVHQLTFMEAASSQPAASSSSIGNARVSEQELSTLQQRLTEAIERRAAAEADAENLSHVSTSKRDALNDDVYPETMATLEANQLVGQGLVHRAVSQSLKTVYDVDRTANSVCRKSLQALAKKKPPARARRKQRSGGTTPRHNSSATPASSGGGGSSSSSSNNNNSTGGHWWSKNKKKSSPSSPSASSAAAAAVGSGGAGTNDSTAAGFSGSSTDGGRGASGSRRSSLAGLSRKNSTDSLSSERTVTPRDARSRATSNGSSVAAVEAGGSGSGLYSSSSSSGMSAAAAAAAAAISSNPVTEEEIESRVEQSVRRIRKRTMDKRFASSMKLIRDSHSCRKASSLLLRSCTNAYSFMDSSKPHLWLSTVNREMKQMCEEESLWTEVLESVIAQEESRFSSDQSLQKPVNQWFAGTSNNITSNSGAGDGGSSMDADDSMEEECVSRWKRIVSDPGYREAHPEEFLYLLRIGVPNSVRGDVWKILAGLGRLPERSPNLFRQLSMATVTAAQEQEIDQDVSRTFPELPVYMQQKGQLSLYRVLKAYSLYDSSVGYTQGCNFVVAILLMYLSEEEAFWSLVVLMDSYQLRDMFLPGFPGLIRELWRHSQLLQRYLPRLHAHLNGLGITAPMYATHWFITVFGGSLPIALVARVWDLFLAKKWVAVHQVALALLKLAEDCLLQCDFDDALLHMMGFCRLLTSPQAVIDAALSFRLTERELDRLGREFAQSGVKSIQEVNRFINTNNGKVVTGSKQSLRSLGRLLKTVGGGGSSSSSAAAATTSLTTGGPATSRTLREPKSARNESSSFVARRRSQSSAPRVSNLQDLK